MKWVKIRYLLIFSLIGLNVWAGDDPLLIVNARGTEYDTYVGVNYKQYWIKAKGEWQKFFVGQQPAADVYLGWRFTPYFGIEFGYEWTNNKPKSFLVPNNSSLLNIQNNTGTDIVMNGKVRFKTGHVDLNAFIPFSLETRTPEGIVSVGVGGMQSNVKISASSKQHAVTNPFTAQFTPLEGRAKAVFRVGLGLQTMIFENMGARVLWRYENTSVLTARNSTISYNPLTRTIFRNSQSLALGIFVKF